MTSWILQDCISTLAATGTSGLKILTAAARAPLKATAHACSLLGGGAQQAGGNIALCQAAPQQASSPPSPASNPDKPKWHHALHKSRFDVAALQGQPAAANVGLARPTRCQSHNTAKVSPKKHMCCGFTGGSTTLSQVGGLSFERLNLEKNN